MIPLRGDMDCSRPTIGILSAHTEREKKLENKRLIEEITELGGDARIVNYRRCAVGVLETGRALFQYDDDKDVPVLVEVDAVIPRVGKFVESGVWVLQLLTSQGVYSTASPDAVATAKSKMSTHIALDAHGVPTLYGIMPTGIRPKDPTETFKLLESDPRRKLIVKTDRGSHGEGVLPPTPRRGAIANAQAYRANNIRYIMQEFAEAPNPEELASDVRIIVVENRIIGAMKRSAKDIGEFRSNIAQGGEGEPYEPTPREAELALRACAVLNLDVGGVDIISSSRGSVVNEVNVSPEFGGIEAFTEADVARHIAELAMTHAVRRQPAEITTAQPVLMTST
jgi:ribosomal protein S6--L-glutamate ligase